MTLVLQSEVLTRRCTKYRKGWSEIFGCFVAQPMAYRLTYYTHFIRDLLARIGR
jgi:hypothetical protein